MSDTRCSIRRPARVHAYQAQSKASLVVRSAYLASLVTDTMDFSTLAVWRSTCRAAYNQTVEHHTRRIRRLLSKFLPASRELLRLMSNCEAVIGGEVALSFVHPDSSIRPEVLEIYTPIGWFTILLDQILHCAAFDVVFDLVCLQTLEEPMSRRRGVRREAVLKTSDHHIIAIYESTTSSACTPISLSWVTALVNFVSEFSYGSGYPRLTENREAFFSDLGVHALRPHEKRTLGALVLSGYRFIAPAPLWPPDLLPRPPPFINRPLISPCMRDRFACPDQGRYFGDRGSLVGLIDPLGHGRSWLELRCLPPFTHMPVWRIWSSHRCSRECSHTDNVLPPDVISITTREPHDSSIFLPVEQDYIPSTSRFDVVRLRSAV